VVSRSSPINFRHIKALEKTVVGRPYMIKLKVIRGNLKAKDGIARQEIAAFYIHVGPD
jgi:hypothetical protein